MGKKSRGRTVFSSIKKNELDFGDVEIEVLRRSLAGPVNT